MSQRQQLDRATRSAIVRVLNTAHYIFEDRIECGDDKMLADISAVRHWLRKS